MQSGSLKKTTLKKPHVLIIVLGILILILVSLLIRKRTHNIAPSDQPPTNSQQPSKSIPLFNRRTLTQKLSEKSKIKASKLVYDFTKLSQNENTIFIYGGLGEKGAPGGKHFFVKITKEPQEIKVIYVGEQLPKCNLLDSHGFPHSWKNLCRSD